MMRALGEAKNSPACHVLRCMNAKLPARVGTRWVLVFHRQSARPAQLHTDRQDRRAAGSDPLDAATVPLPYRRVRGAAGAYAYRVEPAGGRCGFLDPLANDQVALCAIDPQAGASQPCARGARGTRHLAAPFLGAPHQGRMQLRAAHRYCYINPVKHALVRRVQDWPHSSFHRDVHAGIFPPDWAGEIDVAGEFGERV